MTFEELYAKVEKLIPEQPRGVCIGLDGINGTGKSTLALKLAERLGGTAIALDNFLDKNKGMYVPHVRCQEVMAAINACRERVVVVEGVCLRAVAQRCDFTIHVHIYCRNLSANSGLWHDEDICLGESLEEQRQRERELRRAGAAISGREDLDEAEKETGLRDELIEYHARWKPVQRADLVYTVVK